MSKVELTRGRSLTLPNKRKFVAGEVYTDIPAILAVELSERDDFKVTGLTSADYARAEDAADLEGRNLRSLLKAINGLDLDDTNAYDQMGLPNPEAVSKLLGRPVTAEDIAAAMDAAADVDLDDDDENEDGTKTTPAPDADETKNTGKPRGLVINRNTSAKQKGLADLNKVGADKKSDKEEPSIEV